MNLLVDTSAWFALNSRRDKRHRAAIEFVRQFRLIPVIFYTTDYVVDETATLLRMKVSHRQAVNFLNSITRNPNVIRAQVSRDILIRAEEIFRGYSDKRWSYTDCVSFAFMDAEMLDNAFAFDHNFTQYGKIVHP